VEMLELGMDIEADLGVDSIKRVEILGAMRDRFPALPQLKPEELAELRTLEQIVGYMRDHSGGVTPPPSPLPMTNVGAQYIAPTQTESPAPVVMQPVTAVTPAAAPSGLDTATLSAAMLDIVADKTGYPVEMLELGMDIEADLGVDSIKRVEILGAMRDRFPALPQLKPEELAELRTLEQIVSYMRDHSGGVTVTSNGGAANGGTPVPFVESAVTSAANGHKQLPTLQHNILVAPARLHYLPRPDALEIHLPEGSVCVLTDDGTALTGEVATQLTAMGWRVVVLAFPQEMVPVTNAPNGVSRIALIDNTETHLQAALENIAAQHGRIAAVVHLNPPAKVTNGLFIEREKAILKHVFLLAKHLKKPITESALDGFACFVTIARLDGAFGTTVGATQGAHYGAIAGGLFGLAKTLNLEWPDVFCRGVDIAATTSDAQAATQIVAELRDPNRLLAEVACGAQGRTTLIAETSVIVG